MVQVYIVYSRLCKKPHALKTSTPVFQYPLTLPFQKPCKGVSGSLLAVRDRQWLHITAANHSTIAVSVLNAAGTSVLTVQECLINISQV